MVCGVYVVGTCQPNGDKASITLYKKKYVGSRLAGVPSAVEHYFSEGAKLLLEKGIVYEVPMALCYGSLSHTGGRLKREERILY